MHLSPSNPIKQRTSSSCTCKIQWPWSPAPTAGSAVSSPRSCSSAAPTRCTPPHRDPERVQIPGVTPLRLDITDPDSVAGAAAGAGDATLVINNAGIATRTGLADGALAQIELEMDTNFFGPLR